MKRLILYCTGMCLLLLAPGAAGFAAGCGPVFDPENPAFRLEVDLPVNERNAAEMTVQPGTQAVMPVTIVSTGDAVEVSLSISREEEFPEGITITLPEGYASVPPGENITVDITYNVGENVATGLYHTMLTGMLKEPIEGTAGMARSIDIVVTGNP